MTETIRKLDIHLTKWMSDHGPKLLRISLGVVFLWFGFLKFFPGLSPAEDLASRTIENLSFGILSPTISRPLLASLETLIGVGLIFGFFMRGILFLLFFQMLGTFTPLILFTNECFIKFPWVPTLEGQYIIKNIVLVSAALTIGATVRGGAMVADPEEAQTAKLFEDHKAERL